MDFDFSTLITDRSPSDLELLRDLLSTPMSDWTAEQLAAFNQASSKGAYNYTDLNRVTACMEYLNERLTALGYETGYSKVVVPRQGGGGRLPEGYTEVQYIQATGTQYIDTGFIPNSNTRAVMSVNITSSGTAGVLGCRDAVGANAFVFWGLGPTQMRSDYGSNVINFNVASATGLALIDKNKNICNFNDYEAAAPEQVFQVQYPCLIFAMSTGGVVDSRKTSGMLYYFKLYDDDILVRDFIPCINPGGEAGMYDLVGETFYGNAGTGDFTTGPDVPALEPEPDPLDPYTWYESDIPTVSSMAAYLANVTALRGVLTVWEDTPTVPADMTGLTQSEANDIETILGVIEILINNMAAAWFYSGDLYSGEADA